jgi:hypothetical protein
VFWSQCLKESSIFDAHTKNKGWLKTMVFEHNNICNASFDFVEPIFQTRALFKLLWYVLQPIHLKDIEVNLGQYLYMIFHKLL